jgi:hypothetical protein
MAQATPAGPAKSKPVWMDYADLALKALVPIAVLFGTLWVNLQLEHRREAQACIDAQMDLIEFVCGDQARACTPSPERTRQIANVVGLVKSRCPGQPLPVQLTNLAVSVTAASGSADATAKVAEAAAGPTTSAKPEVVTVANAPAPLEAREVASVEARPAPRLYIQYKLASQKDAAERFRQAVLASTFQGRKIVAPGMEFTPRSGVTKTELRCVTKSDCGWAPGLAAYLGAVLGGGPLPVKDISARYRGGAPSRPYEIWFGDEPIVVNGVAGPAASMASSPSAALN